MDFPVRTRKFLAGVAIASSAALVFSGLVVPEAFADEETSAEVAEEITERPDGVAAQITAKATGHRVEDLSLRTATEQVFANPDGTWTSVTTSAARFIEDDGVFVPIGDADELTTTDDPVIGDGTELTVANGAEALGAGPNKDSVVLAELVNTGKNKGAKFELGWEGELPVPDIADNQATYSDQVEVPVIDDSTADVAPQTATVTPDLSESSEPTDALTEPSAEGSEQQPSTSPSASEQPFFAPRDDAAKSDSPRSENGTAEDPSDAPLTETSEDPSINADVVVLPLRSGFSHRTVLDEAPAGGVSLRFPIGLSKGLSMKKDKETGDLRVLDSEGETVFFAPAPTMWDAKIDEASGLPAAERFVETELTEEDGVPVLTLHVDADWLQDPQREYPVTIDPTWSAGVSDTWVQADVPGSKAGDPELRVGTFNGGSLRSRSFLQFVSSALDGKKIVKAELRMHNYHSYSCTSAPVKVQRVTSPWVASDVRWTAQPTATSTGEGSNNVSKGYSSSCAAGYVYYPITPIAQYWADNPTKNYGVRLIAEDETNNYSWKRYRSTNYILGSNDPIEPQFIVTYNSYPSTPSAVSFNSGESVKDAAGKTWVRSKTPTFRATVSDPDGGNVKAEFDMSGTSTLTKQAGTTVASKQVSTYKASLAENGTYTVKAWAHDGSLRSKASGPASTFTVDSVAPSTPTITSSGGISNNGWQSTKPSSNTFTFSSSADTDKFSYQLNNDAWKTVTATSGKATLSWNPTGANILRVKANDKATNTSATTTWTFGNGAASLTSPMAGSTTSDSFKVTGQGPTSATGVVTPKVYWREADSVAADTSTYGSNAGWYEAATLPAIAVGQPVKVDTLVNVAAAPAGKLKELGKDRLATLVEIQVCFDYAGAPAASRLQCTTNKSKKPVQVTKLPHAFGGNYPVAEAGDGQVALATGELNVSETDVEVNAGNTGLSVSRSYSSYSGIGANSRIFGRGWRANIDGPDEGLSGLLVVESTALDGTVTLIDDDESAAVFRQPGNGRVALKIGTYVAANEDASASGWKLALSGSGTSARIKVTEEDGTVTTFKRGAILEGNAKIYEWITETVTGGNGTGTSKFVSNAAGQTTMVIAGTETALACDTTTPVKGCRRINLAYDAAGKITKVTYTAWDPATSAMKTVTIAEYGYDGTTADSRLTSVKDSRTGDVTTYTYGADSAAGVPLLASTEEKTSSGSRVDAPTYYSYGLGNTSSGRADWLEKVERGNPTDGNTRVQAARFVYGINPVADGNNLPDLREERVRLWEQEAAKRPVTGYAVFGPGKNIITSRAGSVAVADYKFADLQYVDPQNRVVNTASYAGGEWQITASVLNEDGNVERSYDARAIRTIKDAAADPANVVGGIVNGHTDQASLNFYWSDLSAYVDENGEGISSATDPALRADEIARNEATAEFLRGYVTDTYSPVTTDENDEPARVHTKTTYTALTDVDAGGMPRMLPTKVLTTKANSGDVDLAVTGEPVLSEVLNGYNAYTVDKDGRAATDKNNLRSGWVIGTPTKVTQVLSPTTNNIVTETRFDDQGRVIETRQPKSAGADAGTTLSVYYTAGANAVDAVCGNAPEFAGYLCKNTPKGAGSVAKHQTGFNIYGQPATFTESSTGTDGAKRTTTQTYRADGQELKTTVTTSGITTTAVAPVEKLYDATGVQNGVRALATGTTPQSEVKWTQDLWGRTTSYTNSLGETTTTEYDGFGNVVKVVSPVSTTTYKYGALSGDGTAEYQGVVTTMTVSNHGGTGTGTYKASYDGDGNVLTQTIPGGFTQKMDYDESGKQVRLAYDGPLKAEDGTTSNGTWIAWELNRDTTGRIVGETTPEGDVLAGTSTAGDRGAAYDRTFTYDRAGRLTEVQDITAQPGETVNTDPAEGAVTPATVRKYSFDKNGNRTSLTTTVNGTQTASRTWAYDAADRVGVGAGYVYDGLGRQTTIPAVDAPAASGGVQAGSGAITISYFADDAAAKITRNGTTTAITRDPEGRRLTVASTGTAAAGAETKHYSDDSDNPAWTSRVQGTQTTTTRYESTIGGDLALTITDNKVELALSNPHGDVVATVPLTGTGAGQGISGWAQYDEYGNQLSEPVNTGATTYGWHGIDQRAVDASGLVLMGARLYNAATGLFTSRDPVEGGNTTSYAYPQDPVGKNDVSGQGWIRNLARGAVIAAGVVGAIACGASIVCGVAVGAAAGAAYYTAKNGWSSRFRWGGLASSTVFGAIGGGGYGSITRSIGWKLSSKYRFGARFSKGTGRGTDFMHRGNRVFGLHSHRIRSKKLRSWAPIHYHRRGGIGGIGRHRPWEKRTSIKRWHQRF
ncbi:DNRLRE domain-containing protein [Glutamicibacter endophyticus]|uniref:DNRLRE domain-containing protein n=1 Tax=Glutamicibacter endophyticus TaxID=1522174 RepID=UPI003AEF9936